MPKRYQIPASLADQGILHGTYERWLRRKAAAHVKRDRLRAGHVITGELYRQRIHEAVSQHGTHDFYTGEKLDWKLVSTYDNVASKAGRSVYKAGFALLPTVDHVLREDGKWDFVICAWRTNDAKNDMSHAEFIALCRRVVAHAEAAVV
ncbi:MAG: hypothetical protein WBL74_12700 [Novosphingobium sp.]|uniref:hypothetical protein n=1 Tax=Novosphingobium sp. TaxID=1874826 RepID=UPI003C7D0803